MLKIKTRFISAVVVLAVAVTAAFGGAVGVAADSIVESAKTELKVGSSYNLSIKTPSTPYDYKIVVPVSGSLTISYEAHYQKGAFQLFNSDGIEVVPSKYDNAVGKGGFYGYRGYGVENGQCRYFDWNDVSEKAVGTTAYKIDKGTYYLRIARAEVGLSDLRLGLSLRNINDKDVDVNGNVIAPPFIAGATASDVTAARSGNAVNVNWGEVNSARYAVYYTYQNPNGTFAGWTIKSVDTPAYTIPTLATGVTYYITVLPYGDNPRAYGGFSAYTLVRT